MASEETCLQQTFAILFGRVGVCDDAAAYAHVSDAVLQDECSDRYVEDGGSVRRHEADCAGVDATRLLLQLANDLHGANFGSTGDGAAGKHAFEDVVISEAGLQCTRYCGGHLQEGFVSFDGEDVFDLYAAHGADAAEIVAEQVDDHDVFTAIFGIVLQLD